MKCGGLLGGGGGRSAVPNTRRRHTPYNCLDDRTNGHAIGTVLRLLSSVVVCLSVTL